MGSATLVDEDIKRGREALQALDDAGVRPGAAFWRYWPESSDWRFVVALPAFNQDGPLRVYDQVQRILKQRQVELPVWRITVLSTQDPVARWAKDRVRGARSDVRSSTGVVDDTLVEDAYIYRSL
jgi:hypothetical protein